MSLTLVVDNCGRFLTAALLRGDDCPALLRLAGDGPHSKTLLPLVDQLLAMAGARLDKLERLAVCRGPGSFSALRIALATMQGLAQALDLPLFTYVHHDLIAWRFRSRPGTYVVCSDARRGQLYWAVYHSDGREIDRRENLRVDDPEKIAARLSGQKITLLGPGLSLYREIMQVDLPGAEWLGESLALPEPLLLTEMPWRPPAGNDHGPGLLEATADQEPLYVRPSDAEINRRRALGKG